MMPSGSHIDKLPSEREASALQSTNCKRGKGLKNPAVKPLSCQFQMRSNAKKCKIIPIANKKSMTEFGTYAIKSLLSTVLSVIHVQTLDSPCRICKKSRFSSNLTLHFSDFVCVLTESIHGSSACVTD